MMSSNARSAACLVLLLSAACGGESPGEDAFGGASASSSTAATTASSSGQGGGAMSSSASEASVAASSTASTGEGGAAGCTDLGDACTTCELAACADVYCGCYGNVECGALAACVEACGGTAECYQGCATEHPEGISHGALLTHCAATDCSNACPGYFPLTECQLCLYADCQAEMNTCVSNPDCTLLLYCLDGCDDAECRNDCYFEHPDGSGDAGPVGTCLQDACASECG